VLTGKSANKIISFLLVFIFISTSAVYPQDIQTSASLRLPLGVSKDRLELARKTYNPENTSEAIASYGLKLVDTSFTQISGLKYDDLDSPYKDKVVTLSLHTTNMAALSAYFNAGYAINPATGEEYKNAKEKKAIADGGTVSILEKMLMNIAKDLDIAIIIGGSEGKTRDGAPALKVKQVINPNGKKGLYIVHADPLENTNAQAVSEKGAWSLFFLTKLNAKSETLLRKDAYKAGKLLQEYLEYIKGKVLAKYKIPFCHDRYVISVSYPGMPYGKEGKKPFSPALLEPDVILQNIANERGVTVEQLGEEAHIVFLERTRHEYNENTMKDLQAKGNKITYSTVPDGDAFVRVVAPLGVPTYKGKKYTIVLGASGGIEGFATGLIGAGRINADGNGISRVRMVHSSKDLNGKNISGWNRYSPEDIRDFKELGIENPEAIITEKDASGYPERIFIASSVTGARPDVDISSDFIIPGVEIIDDKHIRISAFILDSYGRGFLTTTTYESSAISLTKLGIKAENDYGFLDDKNRSVRDFAVRELINAASDSQRSIWEKRLGILGLKEESLIWLRTLLDMKDNVSKEALPKDMDFLIDNVLKETVSLKVSDGNIVAMDNNGVESIVIESRHTGRVLNGYAQVRSKL